MKVKFEFFLYTKIKLISKFWVIINKKLEKKDPVLDKYFEATDAENVNFIFSPFLDKRSSPTVEKEEHQSNNHSEKEDFVFNIQGQKAISRKVLAKVGTIKVKEFMQEFSKPTDFRNRLLNYDTGEHDCSYMPVRVVKAYSIEMISEIKDMVSNIRNKINSEKKFSKVMAIECVDSIIQNTKRIHNSYALCIDGQKRLKTT